MYKKSNQMTVYNSATAYYYHLKILGLFPMPLHPQISKQSSLTRTLDKIYVIFIVCCLFILFGEIYKNRGVSSTLIQKVWELNIYLGAWTIFVAISYQHLRIEGILKIFRHIDEADEKVRKSFLQFKINRIKYH